MGKSTINGHFQLQTVSSPEGKFIPSSTNHQSFHQSFLDVPRFLSLGSRRRRAKCGRFVVLPSEAKRPRGATEYCTGATNTAPTVNKHGDGCVWKCCVPLNPMVLLIIIPFLNGYFIGNIPNIFRQTQMYWRHISKIDGLMWTNMD